MKRLRKQFKLECEPLEARNLMSIAADEQLFVYLMNKARNNPAAYEQELGLLGLLTGIAAQPPLAVNSKLFESAEFHANEMAVNNYFAHTSQVTGDQPNKMARDQGYELPAFYPSAANNIESLSAGLADPAQVLSQLIEDKGVVPPGHRIQLLATSDFFATHREVGVGHAFSAGSTFKDYYAIHTALSQDTDQFVTGVVYKDNNSNGRYDLNEGLAGVNVTAAGTTVQTNAAGGWSIKVAANTTVTVVASGGGFQGTSTGTFAVTTKNREVDFISGQPAPSVDFAALPSLSVLQFSAAAFPIAENGGTATITVTRTGGSAGAVSVNFATSPGTATTGTDYTEASGTLSFGNGESSKTFTVAVKDDKASESDETINLTLSAPTGTAILGSVSSGTLTVLDDDGPGRFQFEAPTVPVVENAGAATVTVVRVLGASGPASVDFTIVIPPTLPPKVQALPGKAFTGSLSGSLTFADGETKKTLAIPIIDNNLVEADSRLFVIQLQNFTAGTVPGAIPQATVAIKDDDLPQVPDAQVAAARLTQAANLFGKSEEHYKDFVTKAYAQFLNRAPDASGLTFWVTLMQRYETSNHAEGLRQEQIEAGFIDSPEYKGRYGGVGEAWVRGIYKDLLGRDGDQGGVNFWLAQLQAGVAPTNVALGFTASDERLRNRVANTYRTLLDREADQPGLEFWVNVFKTGGTTEDIVSGFVGSPEYYFARRGFGNPAKWTREAYLDVLFRPATTSEFGFWLSFLSQ